MCARGVTAVGKDMGLIMPVAELFEQFPARSASGGIVGK